MNKRQKMVQKQFLKNEKAVIKRLEQIYSVSLADVDEKIENLTFTIGELEKEYDWLDPDDPEKAKVKSMIQSKIYQKQYQEQLQKQLSGVLDEMHTKEFLTVSDYLDTCYEDGFIGTIFDAQGQGVPLITPINQEAMVRAVQTESKISKGLYTKLGEDVTLLKKKIAAEVSRSIATGRTFEQTAQQLAGITNIGYNRAARIARTEGHRIQTTATMDAMKAAKTMGADVVKQWDSTLDARTRESHAKVDGEVRELNKPFSNGLQYPGDPKGRAAEVVNCRCALLQRAKWALENESDVVRMNSETGELIKCKDYAEFKEKYLLNIEQRSRANYNKVVGQSDKEMFERYKKVLQENSPKTLEEFYNLKYNKKEEWKALKQQYRVVNQYKMDNGVLSPQQIFELDAKVISEKRNNFGRKYKYSGNVAGAYVDGDINNFYIAHSRINTPEEAVRSKYKGNSNLVQLIDNRQFKYIDVQFNGKVRSDTYYDTEAKIFEYLALQYEKKPFNTVTILSERGMCDSCIGVMHQFAEKYGVKVNAVSNKKQIGDVWKYRRERKGHVQ
jgi:uncharacterized protein with gpF-like domain